MLKRESQLVDMETPRELDSFWTGTEQQYDARVEKIQAKAREKGLPVPSHNVVMAIDAYDAAVPQFDGREAKIKQVRRFFEDYEDLFTDFDRTDRQSQFDFIRYLTDDGETMPDGYLDKVFEQFTAAERQGQ